MSSSNSHHKATRVLACVLCQHRKIKCDRNTPCSNCVKANVACTPSTPAPARKRRRPNQDLQERLARCEQLLKQYASASTGPPGAPGAPNPNPAVSAPRAASSAFSKSSGLSDPIASTPSAPSTAVSAPSALSSPSLPSLTTRDITPTSSSTPAGSDSPDDGRRRAAGKVTVEDGNVTFTESYFWTSIQDQLQAMKNILETEDLDENSPFSSDAMTPDDNIDLLLENISAIELDEVAPEPVQVFRLWQLFLERVNPVTKVIHTPSMQPQIINAAANHASVPHNVQALLFAIYTMAAISLTDREARQMLEMSREQAIKKYTSGLKAALSKVNFLRNYDLTTLQALVLFIFSLQGRYNQHATWVLCGTVIRIAQKMGLHRDGELLGLPPFETEMRRRIWWQMSMLDTKFALTSGFSLSMTGASDTRVPLNVNDSDLFPGSMEPITPRQGPTEMAFCLFLYEVGNAMMNAPGRLSMERMIVEGLGTPTAEAHRKEAEQYLAAVSELKARLGVMERQYLDPTAGGVHHLARQLHHMIACKVQGVLVPMQEQPEWGTEINNMQDQMFKMTLIGVENHIEPYRQLDGTGFLWFQKLQTHPEVIAVLASQLVDRPTGSLVDRAWAILQLAYDYHDEFFDLSQRQNLTVAAVLLKSWRHRERVLAQMGLPISTPKFIRRLTDLVPHSSSSDSSSAGGPSPVMANESKAAAATAAQQVSMNPFLGGLLEPAPSFDWDMWPEMTMDSLATGPELNIGAFGGFNNFAPTTNNW